MEVKKLGVTLDTCPYYSTREAIKNAEVIFTSSSKAEKKQTLNSPCVQIIAMPYNMLLHNPTRSASGIFYCDAELIFFTAGCTFLFFLILTLLPRGVDIKGNVVVIDEAHNIIEALSSVYSVSITLLQVLIKKKFQILVTPSIPCSC
jgi:Rad3-related DNA helicase